MLEIKKDWLYPAKIVYGCFVIVQLFFLILGFLLSGQLVPLAIAVEIYQTTYQLSIIFILIYPLFALKMLSPRRSNFFDAPLLTANLPYSKKELFWQSIEHWLYLMPLYFIAQTAIFYFMDVIQLGGERDAFIQNYIFNNLLVAPLVIALILQGMIAIILFLVQNLNWYQVVIPLIIFNILYQMIAASTMDTIIRIFNLPNHSFIFNLSNYHLANIYQNFIFIPGIFLLFISLIFFKCNFHKIEKIYQ